GMASVGIIGTQLCPRFGLLPSIPLCELAGPSNSGGSQKLKKIRISRAPRFQNQSQGWPNNPSITQGCVSELVSPDDMAVRTSILSSRSVIDLSIWRRRTISNRSICSPCRATIDRSEGWDDLRSAAKNRKVIPALKFQNAFSVRRVPRRSTILVETVSTWYGRPTATVQASTQ